MKKQKGFSLLELMVALAVAAIMSTVAVPALRSFIQNSNALAQANELVTALNYSRSEAVKRRMPVVMCAFNTAQNSCATSSVPWDENGWMVFADRDRDSAYDADDGDGVLEDGEDALLKEWKDIKDVDVTSGVFSLSYLQSGTLSGISTIGLKVSADDSSDANRCVRILNTGWVERIKMASGVTCP
jgi:prepilin-type N-terminal cleavage/methylation domain-containing protein